MSSAEIFAHLAERYIFENIHSTTFCDMSKKNWQNGKHQTASFRQFDLGLHCSYSFVCLNFSGNLTIYSGLNPGPAEFGYALPLQTV